MVNNIYPECETYFDALLPEKYRDLSQMHWTPEPVVDIVVNWLEEINANNVLDIGSGVGKFCILGAQKSNLHFTGVEKRTDLHEEALKISGTLNLKQLAFVNDNITNIDFSQFDAFYYYNPFFEQICDFGWIDNKVSFSSIKFLRYKEFVFKELEKAKSGTAIVIYYSMWFKLPTCYVLKQTMLDDKLQLWVKD